MKTLREIGEFVGFPQGAADRFNTNEPISLVLAGRLVTLLDRNERTSMRAMAAALEGLPPVTLEAKLTSVTVRPNLAEVVSNA